MENQKSVPPDVVVPNCYRCDYCQGAVDRYPHVFQCRSCGAIGDLITGILCPPYPGENQHDDRHEKPLGKV